MFKAFCNHFGEGGVMYAVVAFNSNLKSSSFLQAVSHLYFIHADETSTKYCCRKMWMKDTQQHSLLYVEEILEYWLFKTCKIHIHDMNLEFCQKRISRKYVKNKKGANIYFPLFEKLLKFSWEWLLVCVISAQMPTWQDMSKMLLVLVLLKKWPTLQKVSKKAQILKWSMSGW